MHAHSFTFLALMTVSFTAFSLPLSKDALYGREDLDVYARDTDQYLFDRYYDEQAARSLEERDIFTDLLPRSDLQERFFLTKILGAAVHGISSIAGAIKRKKQQKAQAKQRQQAQQAAQGPPRAPPPPPPRPQAPPQQKKHKGKRDYMDELVERDFEDIFARDVVDWLYERSPEEQDAMILARRDVFPEYYVRSIEDLD